MWEVRTQELEIYKKQRTTPGAQEEGCRRSSDELFVQIQSPIDIITRRRWKVCLYKRGQQWTRNTLSRVLVDLSARFLFS
jgi:hypothetical protein